MELILGYMNYDDGDSKFCKILLKLQPPVYGYKNVEFLLRKSEELSVLKGVPTLIVNCSNVMLNEKLFNARVYALVNEDAHSTSWLLAKSRTVRT